MRFFLNERTEKFNANLLLLKVVLVNFKSNHHMFFDINSQEDTLMYISLEDSRTKGFRKWADAHRDVGNAGADGKRAPVVVTDPDRTAMTASGHPHRPWLVPGAGRL